MKTIVLLFIPALLHAQTGATTWWSTFGTGGGTSVFGNQVAVSSVGQQIGSTQGGNLRIVSGFFAPSLLNSGLTNVEEETSVPRVFALYQNYPNPFNPSTTIAYDLPSLSRVSIQIFNLLGQAVATIVNDEQPAGQYKIVWDGKNTSGISVSSGIYFYRIHARESEGEKTEFIRTNKLVLLK